MNSILSIWISQRILTLAGLSLLLLACGEQETPAPAPEPFSPTPLQLEYPFYFPFLQIPKDNPQTVEAVKLGKFLYFDTKLSENGPMRGFSCSSCHMQPYSFTAPVVGVEVLPHINLGWNSSFLWEGKVNGVLEDVMLFEVKEFFKTDLNILLEDENYRMLFMDAFGDEEISYERAAKALAQFSRTLISANSKYDKYLKGEEALSISELNGLNMFFSEKADCFHCHPNPLMNDNLIHNIGLDAEPVGEDAGRYNSTGNDLDRGKFKTPTLRNIELTAPYMHDGRFKTLEEVVEFYNAGVSASPNLDPIMTKDGKNMRLDLTEEEKADLVAFLKTLTDNKFVTNPDFTAP